ncbi:hypothetical protein B0I35DRAFT_513886 [Stachybotrys elegans]|uniref:Uncharacterized protein n=1 Tax=Stachybotrys elegans TaxID=80388 RepID=A0A8K0WPU7_9HYPO|nr:hypothetical protein B0I35DRAFT_513886 [Stachybotrys elegans]
MCASTVPKPKDSLLSAINDPAAVQVALDIQRMFGLRISAAAALAFAIALLLNLSQVMVGSRRKHITKFLLDAEYDCVAASVILGLASLISVVQVINGMEYGTGMAGNVGGMVVEAGQAMQSIQASAFAISATYFVVLALADRGTPQDYDEPTRFDKECMHRLPSASSSSKSDNRSLSEPQKYRDWDYQDRRP